jgi:OOP family OmpA-OmpF porin
MSKMSLLVLFAAAALVTGCATKNYVKATVTPVQTKVDQVSDQTNKNTTAIDQTNQNVAKNTTAISAVDEKATTADRRATDAQTSANTANQKATQDAQDISSLRGVITNLDDYKVAGSATILFGVNRATLSKDDQAQLDQLASSVGSIKHYFVAVSGYTDDTGDASYNVGLSQRRADAVVQYLAGTGKVPFFQIRTVGLGDQAPVDPGKTRDARAKNRRVEVKVYSADASYSAANGGSR